MRTYPVYLNGSWVTNDASIPIINPATGEAFARISTVDGAGVVRAISDAHAAFGAWRQIPGKHRGESLRKVAAEMERRREEIGRVITLESGKPLAQSLGEVAMAVDHLRWFADEARRAPGRVMPNQADQQRDLVIRCPVGVVAAISPWNFPLMLATRKIAPALAAGCTVILKPSSRTPLSAVALAECIQTADLPPGAFQFLVGHSDTIAAEFLDNPLCRLITFTGSTKTGRKLIAGSVRQIKPLILELGGLAPVLVFEDCDINTAVKGTMLAKFRNAGQSCIAASRIFVQRPIYEDFVERLVEQAALLTVGDGFDPQTQIGPLIDEAAVSRAQEHVQDGIGGGAKLLCGGGRVQGPGFFFEPTILSGIARTSLCMYEETFAPIAPIAPFDSESEAIELANNSNYGLGAYAFTSDVSRTFRLAETLEAGIIGINNGLPTASQCPFGGMKQSGWGRELGSEGLDAFLDTKHVSIELD